MNNTINLIKLSSAEASAHNQYLGFHNAGKAYVTDCQKFSVGKNKHGMYIIHDIAKREAAQAARHAGDYSKQPNSVIGHGRTLKVCKEVIALHLESLTTEEITPCQTSTMLVEIVDNEYTNGQHDGTWAWRAIDAVGGKHGKAVLAYLVNGGLAYRTDEGGDFDDDVIGLTANGMAAYYTIKANETPANDTHTNFLAALGCTALGC